MKVKPTIPRPTPKLEFCKYDESFLEMSWQWLNDPEIKQLTMTPDFTRDDQIRWFTRLPAMTNYLIWGLKLGGTPIGAMGLKNLTSMDAEYWGYIGERRFWGVGLGQQIMEFSLEQARQLKLTSLYLRVHRSNERAVQLYEKSSFSLEREDSDVRFMRRKIKITHGG